MTKYLGFQYSVTYGTAVTRTEVTLCRCNQCETAQLLTLTSYFIAPALWPAKSPDLKPLDYRIWSNLQERVLQPDSWRWPAEVAPDQEWEQFQHPFINEAVRQWRPRLLACIRAHGGHLEHKLLVCLIFAQTYTLTVISVTSAFLWSPALASESVRPLDYILRMFLVYFFSTHFLRRKTTSRNFPTRRGLVPNRTFAIPISSKCP